MSPAALDPERIRREAERFLREASQEEYENLAGLRADSRLAAIYERYAHLADRGLVAEALEDARALPRSLAEFLVGHYAGRATAALADRLLAEEAGSVLDLPGERVTYRNAAVAIRNEPDRARRDRLARARADVDGRLNATRAAVWARTYDALAEVGRPDYIAMCASFSGTDYPALAERLARFARDTDDLFRDYLGYYLKKWVGTPLAGSQQHDAARLLRAPDLDRLFPRGDLLGAAGRTAEGLGFALDAGGRITIDAEPREGKSPRAFCMPVEVPARVILVVMPQGGQDDFRAFLHEMGHALHFAHVDAGLPFEARHLGDSSVTEGYAFAVEHLVRSRPWLTRHLGLSGPAADDYLRFAWFEQLHFLRRYGAKLAYELTLHAGNAAGAPPGSATARRLEEAYRAALGGALLVEYPPALYLADADPGFYSARYLRAWMFEAQLRAELQERFDDEWFRNPRAGAFFRDLFAQGQPPRLESLAASVGLEAPDLGPLEREVVAGLA